MAPRRRSRRLLHECGGPSRTSPHAKRLGRLALRRKRRPLRGLSLGCLSLLRQLAARRRAGRAHGLQRGLDLALVDAQRLGQRRGQGVLGRRALRAAELLVHGLQRGLQLGLGHAELGRQRGGELVASAAGSAALGAVRRGAVMAGGPVAAKGADEEVVPLLLVADTAANAAEATSATATTAASSASLGERFMGVSFGSEVQRQAGSSTEGGARM